MISYQFDGPGDVIEMLIEIPGNLSLLERSRLNRVTEVKQS